MIGRWRAARWLHISLALMCAAWLAHADAAAVPVSPGAATQVLAPHAACVQPAGTGECQAIDTALPFHWDQAHSHEDGSARFTFAFDLPPGAMASHALLLPRAGNGVEVWLNGHRIFQIGQAGTQRHDAVKRPWLVPLPAAALAPSNRLEIAIHATMGRAAQLQAPEVGEHAAVAARFDALYLWRVEVTRALMWMSLMLGLMALLMWWVQREAVFVACAMAEICWSVRLAEMFWVDMPLDWQVWGAGVATVFAATQLAMTQLFLRAVGRWTPFFRRAYGLYVLAWCVVVPAMVMLRWRDLWLGWLFATTAMYALLALYVGLWAFRERHFWRWLFAAWVVCSVAGGVADLAESAGSMYSHPTYSRLVMAGFSLALVALVARRLLRAREAERQRQDQMTAALERQQAELQQLHAEQARHDLERAMQHERERVMRDMHDGLGGQLSAVLALAERPQPPPKELQHMVRIAIDELRHVVDAMSPFDGDVAALLGSLRPQLERRLALAGIGLHWAVDELPPAAGLGPAQVQHLRRLLLEAATNIARHSGAGQAELSARVLPGSLEVRFADDGRGFDAGADHPGHGLRNIRWRAQALGAAVRWEHSDGERPGTALVLALPLSRPAAPPSGPTGDRRDP